MSAALAAAPWLGSARELSRDSPDPAVPQRRSGLSSALLVPLCALPKPGRLVRQRNAGQYVRPCGGVSVSTRTTPLSAPAHPAGPGTGRRRAAPGDPGGRRAARRRPTHGNRNRGGTAPGERGACPARVARQGSARAAEGDPKRGLPVGNAVGARRVTRADVRPTKRSRAHLTVRHWTERVNAVIMGGAGQDLAGS